jgi:hypothetical protein
MSAPLPRTLVICLTGLFGAALAGCGTPRVSEVYRFSDVEPVAGPSAAVAAPDPAHAQLREITVSAQSMHAARQRVSADATEVAVTPPHLVLLGTHGTEAGILHGCDLRHVARFTAESAKTMSAQQMLAGGIRW